MGQTLGILPLEIQEMQMIGQHHPQRHIILMEQHRIFFHQVGIFLVEQKQTQVSQVHLHII
jgi:hypothetical protein